MDRFKTFSDSVVELNRYLQKIKDIEMRKFSLRANHAMCLYHLGQHDKGLTAAQLTELCKEDKSAISRSLSQLVKKGLVACDIPENKRAYRSLNYLTDSGRALIKKINGRIDAAVASAGKGLTDVQRTAFYSSLEIILNNLSNYLNQMEDTQ